MDKQEKDAKAGNAEHKKTAVYSWLHPTKGWRHTGQRKKKRARH